MIEPIDPANAEIKLAQILGEDFLAEAPKVAQTEASPNLFEEIFSKAVESLEGVSRSELYANQLIDKYAEGQADLQRVVMAQAKMSIMVQFAMSAINSAVQSFKEITSMQV